MGFTADRVGGGVPWVLQLTGWVGVKHPMLPLLV